MKWFVNLKIRTRLNICFLFIGIIAAAIGAAGIITVVSSNIPHRQTFSIIIGAVSLLAVFCALLLGNINAFLIIDPTLKNDLFLGRYSVGNYNIKDVARARDAITMEYQDEIGKVSRTMKGLRLYVNNLEECVKRVAQGDLSVEVPTCSPEDQLGNGLSELVGNFHHLVTSIVTAIDQVSSGANLVSDSSLALSQGATEQASTVQELTAALEQISSQTHLNAQNAEKANALTMNVKLNATDGNAQMKEMLKAMEEINESSTNISKIIKVIDDIAFQTNILALNAAVEAARAGQHGKGFAVVAEEVRNLAAKSANAAKETTALIEGSKRKVDAGTKIANDTAEALGQIVSQVAVAADLVKSIAEASGEQAHAIEQVNSGILQVSQVVSNNAATSQESAAASEELSSQASQLKETISVFKLKRTKKELSRGSTEKTQQIGRNTAVQKISLGDNNFGKY